VSPTCVPNTHHAHAWACHTHVQGMEARDCHNQHLVSSSSSTSHLFSRGSELVLLVARQPAVVLGLPAGSHAHAHTHTHVACCHGAATIRAFAAQRRRREPCSQVGTAPCQPARPHRPHHTASSSASSRCRHVSIVLKNDTSESSPNAAANERDEPLKGGLEELPPPVALHRLRAAAPQHARPAAQLDRQPARRHAHARSAIHTRPGGALAAQGRRTCRALHVPAAVQHALLRFYKQERPFTCARS
jgi:hypothetical protein